ncbi:LamG-like jellyroll fold domain-containing protein [Flavobacterium sp. GSA192]|uniref:LamG-like jellyroll fold domain-containing protein n=1 Tax=Flavobacterium sp. GSA192 TaxID=2576304 RepID=UPI00112CA695|nr:LamG-like jellyroll fold domain-containing protein [Flavobacterium sp. GSA192]
MKFKTLLFKQVPKALMICGLVLSSGNLCSQTLAFPEATGFGRFTTGARGAANPQIYLVTNLNDSGPGSFRDAVSQEGRFVIFKVGGIVNLQSQIVVAKNTTIAGQTAPGEGIVFLGPRVTFTGASNTIARYLRIRYGGTAQNQDASGLANGANMIFDHMTFTWGTDEVFSINWDSKGTSPDNITIQNSIIGQGLHRHNHSAGGLIQPSAGGKISLIGNLYICNKTRNNKIKGINEFVNNVVYNWGNYGNTYGHSESGDAYIMGGDSAGSSDVNIINNYFIGGPNTSTSVSTPFNRGNANFFLYGAGNYFDNNRNGILDGTLVPQDLTGYPTGDAASILPNPYDYPMKNPNLTAQGAFDKIVSSVGASYPRRDQVDNLMISDLLSKGTTATYVYVQSDLTSKFGFVNDGAGHVYGAPAPLDTDNDGMPDAWEDANGLNKNSADALAVSTTQAPYLNIEVYINGLTNQTPPDFIIPPTAITFNASSVETPPSSTVVLNWKDNSDNETNFVIERSIDGTNFTQIAQVAANTITYTNAGLVPNTKYYYRIKAITATESSSYSDVNSVTTPAIPSAPAKTANPNPTNEFNYAEPTNGSLILKWTGSSNTTTYAVYIGTDPSNLNKVADVNYVASPSYSVSGLNSGTEYYWRVDATNVKGTATGNVWSFRTISEFPLNMVGHWPFKEAAGEGDEIADLSNYSNNGKLDSDFDNSTVKIIGKANNALNFSTSKSNNYMASIPNEDQIYLNKNSFSISFWMNAAPSLLPTGSTASAYLLCKGSFTKNATTGATGKRYNIEFKSGELRFAIDDDVIKKELKGVGSRFYTGNWEHVVVMRDVTAHKLRLYLNGVLQSELDETGVTGIGEPTDLILGNIGTLELAVGTAPAPYKGKLDELKVFNYALSAAEIAAIYNTTVINAPSNLTFETNTVATPLASTTAILNWNDNSNNEANFVLERSLDGIDFDQIAELAANTTTYTDTNVVHSTKYYYRLKAINKTDSSNYSEVFEVVTEAAPAPVKATNPTPENGSYFLELPVANFNLAWKGNIDATKYTVYFGTDPENLSPLTDVSYSENLFYQLPSDLTSRVYYYWRVDATNDYGTTTGDVWSFRITTNEIVVHPNPVKEQVNINIPNYNSPNITATLMDNSGNKIFEKTLESNGNSKGNFKIHFTDRKMPGVYILNITGEDLNNNVKLLIK